MFKNPDNEIKIRAQKLEALGQFAGGIAHDFNNILSIIDGCASIALKQLQEGTLQPEQLQRILKSTARGAGLTRQLLAFGRQKVGLEEKLDLCDFIAQLQDLFRPALNESISFRMDLSDAPLWVEASKDQITQVMLNLIVNARDAVAGGNDRGDRGEVSVLCLPCRRKDLPEALKKFSSDYARISVVDNGQGIRSDILPRIFEPFFTTKSNGAGTGLGLSVVYGIVQQLRGHVEVISETGRGTVFEIYLPQTAAPVISATPLVTPHDLLEGKTVLLAEDEEMLRDVLAVMLGDMKMKVLPASNGNEAFRLQETYGGEIDFLLTDVVMPEMDGLRLGELFAKARPQSNIIYMSGYPFLDGPRSLSVPGDAAFLAKPLHEENVRKILERALQRRDERLENEDKPLE